MPVSFQMVVSEGIRCTKPAYERSLETGKNDRKRKDQGNSKTTKRSVRNTTNLSSKKKKAEEELRILYNKHYYTDQDITDDDI